MLYALVTGLNGLFKSEWNEMLGLRNICLLGLSTLGLIWLLWRLYIFTFLPFLRPREPKDLPSWIPCMYHKMAFRLH
jgi:cholesterol 7alpha-monooxygenase